MKNVKFPKVMFDSYYLGCLVNFAYHQDEDGVFFVHDKYSSLQLLYILQDKYRNQLKGEDLVLSLKTVSANMVYGSPNGFKCVYGCDIRQLPLFPGETEEENWKYMTGLIDMNGQLEIKGEELCLTVHFNDHSLLRCAYDFMGVPGLFDEETIVYTSTNVIDLFGKLVDSFKRTELNLILEKRRVLPVCRWIRKDRDAVMPTKARLSDVGYDVTVIRKVKDLTSTTGLYDTGFAISIPFGYYVEVVPRSSLSKSGFMLANSVGIIDPGYKGNLYIALTKVDPEARIELPFRCCQIIFKKQTYVDLVETNMFGEPQTTRGSGGFGSTGK